LRLQVWKSVCRDFFPQSSVGKSFAEIIYRLQDFKTCLQDFFLRLQVLESRLQKKNIVCRFFKSVCRENLSFVVLGKVFAEKKYCLWVLKSVCRNFFAFASLGNIEEVLPLCFFYEN